ncbi:CxxH/CxxC protein [Anoxybacillus sp. UARK-01]|uniref:CxxH/CxxC protein n=1 Tax=Anoxybacillus sp. UARK-01 TaxID=1895648 RepID=UPI0009BA68AC|nr:CxxH/CxxC protein [Anoxybacillus sp. UARK-01]OQM44473.1 CxxH/CxxC protein [Anoxybacillus sp. UARK-01]
MIMCCEEHMELAIDVYVDNHEKAPEIYSLSVDKYDGICEYCSRQAAYIVGN